LVEGKIVSAVLLPHEAK